MGSLDVYILREYGWISKETFFQFLVWGLKVRLPVCLEQNGRRRMGGKGLCFQNSAYRLIPLSAFIIASTFSSLPGIPQPTDSLIQISHRMNLQILESGGRTVAHSVRTSM